MNFAFHWVVDTFTWKGATGSYGEHEVKTDIGSTQDKWLYSKPCCGPLGSIPQAGNNTIVLRVAESHRLANLVQFGRCIGIILQYWFEMSLLPRGH